MKKFKLLCSLVVLVLMLVIGCENTDDITLDELAIEDYISNEPDFAGYFSFDEHYGEEDTVTRLRTITGPSIWYR